MDAVITRSISNFEHLERINWTGMIIIARHIVIQSFGGGWALSTCIALWTTFNVACLSDRQRNPWIALALVGVRAVTINLTGSAGHWDRDGSGGGSLWKFAGKKVQSGVICAVSSSAKA